MAHPNPEIRRLYILLGALFVFVLPLCLFSGVKGFYFVTFDDGMHLYRNPLLNPPTWPHLKILWTHLHNGLYEPFTYTLWSLAVKANLFFGKSIAMNPGFFHSINLLIHAINGMLVYFLLQFCCKSTRGALLGALLFVLHPLQVESFAWISSFNGLLATLLGLCSLLSFLVWLECKEGWGYGLSLGFYILALLSKPSVVTFPLIMACLAVFRFPKLWRSLFLLLVPFAVSAIVIAILTKIAQPDSDLRFITPWFSRPFILVDSIIFYLSKLIFPFALSPNYGRTPDQVLALKTTPYEGLLLVALVYLIYRRKERALFFSAFGVFVFALLPTLGLLSFNFQKYATVADRYAYLALVGPALLCSSFFSRKTKPAMVLCILGLLGWCAIKSRSQMRYWQSDTTNVQLVARVNPNADHHFNLAEMLWAEAEGRNPVPGTPSRPYAIPLTETERDQRVGQIETHYRKALQFRPAFLEAQYRMALFLASYGKAGDKKRWLEEAKNLEPKIFLSEAPLLPKG